ncbi:hypothetical protein IAI18_07725 [Acetobacteraceae bacterium H6797]|nr:hypothetical protein [Acetobacteraceae bacterium H6797]
MTLARTTCFALLTLLAACAGGGSRNDAPLPPSSSYEAPRVSVGGYMEQSVAIMR